MKKIMATVAGMLLVSLMAVNAQVTQQDTQITQDTTGITNQSGQPGVMGDDQSNYTRDMEVIQPTDVPSSLRTTLGESEYSGWEEGKVYHNTSTNEYLIVIGDEDAKVFRFDANGERMEDLGSESNQNDSQMTPGSGSNDAGDAGMGDVGSGSTGTTTDDANSGSTGTTPGSTGTTPGSTGTGSTNSGSTGSGSTNSGSTGTGSTGTGSTTDDQSSGSSNTR